MVIEDIKNGALTEAAKMDIIAEYVDQSSSSIDLDGVLENGNTATNKYIELLKEEGNDDDKADMSYSSFAASKSLDNGTATCQMTSDGSLFLEYSPTSGDMTYLHIRVNGGTPSVMMSDDMKEAFLSELGLNSESEG